MKWKLFTALTLLLSVIACAPQPTVTRDWCLLDEWQTVSHQDTPYTQEEILRHNNRWKAYGCPMPKAK